MSTSDRTVLVAIKDEVVIIKLNGRADVTVSASFKKLVIELRQRGFGRFMIELSDCLNMDSTFLGVLANQGVQLGKAGAPGDPKAISLVGSNDRIKGLLDNLGVLTEFELVDESLDAHLSFETVDPRGAKPDRAEITRTSLEAHKVLMDLNPENVSKFKEVTKFLEEDLKALEGGSGEGE